VREIVTGCLLGRKCRVSQSSQAETTRGGEKRKKQDEKKSNCHVQLRNTWQKSKKMNVAKWKKKVDIAVVGCSYTGGKLKIPDGKADGNLGEKEG